MSSEVLLEVEGGVASIVLNAPERRNAFVPAMVAELLEICDRVDADESIGAVVVRANGPSFCAGASRTVLADAGLDPARPDRYKALGLTYNAFVRVGQLLAPTVAAVRGHAVGAGVNLMLATDLRIVALEARITTASARTGLHPGGGHLMLLARLAGREAAAAMSVFGEEIDGRRAAELGLAWEALPGSEVGPRALSLARQAAGGPEVGRAAVRSFRLELGAPGLPWPAP